LLVQPSVADESLDALAKEAGFLATDRVSYGSHALQFDWMPLHVWKRT